MWRETLGGREFSATPTRRRLSYANVVATLALFVALGGTGYAALTITGANVRDASLTGRDVKNSSLTSADVKNGSLLKDDVKAGQLPAGPAGPPTAQSTSRSVVTPLESFGDAMVEMGVCRFRVVLSAANGVHGRHQLS